jgi:hypothetical protein
LSSLEIAVVSIWSHQVEVVLDMHDWDGDMLIVDANSNLFVKIILSSWLEVDWCFREQLVNLLFNFPLADLVVLHICGINVVLWSSLLVLDLLHLLMKNGFLLSCLSILIHSLSRVFLLELNHFLFMESVLLVKSDLVNLGFDL